MEMKIKNIYNSLNDSERFGLVMGLFPIRLRNERFEIPELVKLMELSEKYKGKKIEEEITND